MPAIAATATARAFSTGEDSLDLAKDVHMRLAYGMLAVAASHFAAAFKHRWLDGHHVIRRMTFGRG